MSRPIYEYVTEAQWELLSRILQGEKLQQWFDEQGAYWTVGNETVNSNTVRFLPKATPARPALVFLVAQDQGVNTYELTDQAKEMLKEMEDW